MGLVAITGILVDLAASDEEGAAAYVSDFERINTVLLEEGLPAHTEPRDGFEPLELELAGYTLLHHLRRIAAHRALGHPLPEPWDEKSGEDEVVEDYYHRLETNEDVSLPFEHLMVHSDAEGYYLPIPMARPIYLEDEDEVPGMTLGSSVALVEELSELWQLLDIPPDIDGESEALSNVPQGPTDGALWTRHGGASFVCVRLLAAARASVAHGAALVFG